MLDKTDQNYFQAVKYHYTSAPAPLAAWYVDIISLLTPNSWIKGCKTTAAIAVVQFGLAMSLEPWTVSKFISGTYWVYLTSEIWTILVYPLKQSTPTTSGTSASYRQAEELSITTGPSPAASNRALTRENSAETAKKIIWHNRARSKLYSWTIISPKDVTITLPLDLADEYKWISDMGNSLSFRHLIISTPTAPVAPTIPTT